MVIEDEEGNVLATEDTSRMSPEEKAARIEAQRNNRVLDLLSLGLRVGLTLRRC
jgi:hypothetical protein